MFRHDHVALTVRDLQISREFYEYLGGHVVSKPSPAFMEIVLGEIRLHLVRRAAGEKLDAIVAATERTPSTAGRATDAATDAATAEQEEAAEKQRIDHLCLRVSSIDDLASIRDRINAHPTLRGRAPCTLIDSPPLGEGKHLEELPPRKTLYFEDPDGIRLEVRAYS
jgi:catechol 2,3-dioxygenase-like lactoylglutathione lyase family enzyme